MVPTLGSGEGVYRLDKLGELVVLGVCAGRLLETPFHTVPSCQIPPPHTHQRLALTDRHPPPPSSVRGPRSAVPRPPLSHVSPLPVSPSPVPISPCPPDQLKFGAKRFGSTAVQYNCVDIIRTHLFCSVSPRLASANATATVPHLAIHLDSMLSMNWRASGSDQIGTRPPCGIGCGGRTHGFVSSASSYAW